MNGCRNTPRRSKRIELTLLFHFSMLARPSLAQFAGLSEELRATTSRCAVNRGQSEPSVIRRTCQIARKCSQTEPCTAIAWRP
jgi:hypothetical protein